MDFIRKRIVPTHYEVQSDTYRLVGILCVDLFAFGSNINLEVTIGLPLGLFQLYFADLLFEDSLTDYYPEETVA